MQMPDDHDAAPAAQGALFAPTRVDTSRRGRIVATLAIAAITGLVAIGALDRATTAPHTATVLDASAPAAATQPAQTPRSSRPPPGGSLGPGSEHGTAPDAPITLDVQLADDHVFVHGEAFSLDVARVSVRIQDSTGHTAATSSVELPGGSTAFRIGAVQRFEVHFMLSDETRANGFVVSATALDAAGRELTTIHELVAGAATVQSPSADPLVPTVVVVASSQAGPLSVRATRRSMTVSIRGELTGSDATRVLVSMQALDGQPAGSAWVWIARPTRPGPVLQPTPFDVQLDIPLRISDRVLVVQTSAYDGDGRLLVTTRVQLAPEVPR
jgi:hypothetical protein